MEANGRVSEKRKGALLLRFSFSRGNAGTDEDDEEEEEEEEQEEEEGVEEEGEAAEGGICYSVTWALTL